MQVDEGNTLSWSVQPHKKSMYAPPPPFPPHDGIRADSCHIETLASSNIQVAELPISQLQMLSKPSDLAHRTLTALPMARLHGSQRKTIRRRTFLQARASSR